MRGRADEREGGRAVQLSGGLGKVGSSGRSTYETVVVVKVEDPIENVLFRLVVD